ncbi:kinase-like protein [Zymoseptoria brevis]|uniref:non-specific serine/threonine protein kinase n=1 Tax=Zymoseptoria brevis TaxID=1047168 RepID=A0A0F4GKN7_9PEZI|nr:kinase-like protein [Zymoseptoria brevis]
MSSHANIVGATTAAQLARITESQSFDFVESDGFTWMEDFNGATEGKVQVFESERSEKLYVCKHTFSRAINDLHEMKDGDTATHPYPVEARILLKHLKPHPCIISLFACTADPAERGRYKLWMQYCSGGDLVGQAWASKERRLVIPEQFFLQVAIQTGEALAYLHHGLRHVGDGKYTQDAGHEAVIHGDVKGDNIFLCWQKAADRIGNMPDVVLGDFGAAKLASDRNSMTGIGTPGYHSPEDKAVYGDRDWNDPSNRAVFIEMISRRTTACDIYAFGQVLYQLATKDDKGWPIGKDPASVEISARYGTPGLRDFVVSCLAVDPRRRGEASFAPGTGFLPAVQRLRDARARLVQSRRAPSRLEWYKPPKLGS